LSESFPTRIYLLDPRQYSPETIAVAFAKTSRSSLPFDEIAAELNEEKSTEFNEKWVVGYGHASVAEHAVLHLAIENVSRLAVETIEGNRLASYTEKSTRYQKWDPRAYYLPHELKNHTVEQEFRHICTNLFSFYIECQPHLQSQLIQTQARLEGESNKVFERRMQSLALDAARYLLPAASLANLGMTANARTLEHAISKMLTSPLEEVRQIGATIKVTACSSVPTLIKYASANEHLHSMPERLAPIAKLQASTIPSGDWLRLVNYNSLGVEKILASLLFRYGNLDYEHCYQQIVKLSPDEKKAMLESILDGLGVHDSLPHEFEHTSYTFDVIMDQGAYYEVKRHRMMTQSPQELGAGYGYATPRVFEDSGLLARYQLEMEAAASCWEKLASWNPAVASYIVPNGFNRRILISMNIREAYAFIKLRTSPNAHFAVRRVASRMAEEITKAHPLFGALLFKNSSENSESLSSTYYI
jgi:thymidylate synthase ThyX